MQKARTSVSSLGLMSFAFVLMAAGLLTWSISDRFLNERLLADDPARVVEELDGFDSKDKTIPFSACRLGERAKNRDLLSPRRFSFPHMVEESPYGAICRLKMVRLTPPIGPPPTFFV